MIIITSSQQDYKKKGPQRRRICARALSMVMLLLYTSVDKNQSRERLSPTRFVCVRVDIYRHAD